jgi:adenylate cyclase
VTPDSGGVTPQIQAVVDWLVEGAPPAKLPQDVLLHLCRRLVACGLPLYRVAVFVTTLHPNVAGRGFFWRENRDEVEVAEASFAMLQSGLYLNNPIHLVLSGRTEVRRPICDGGCPMDFPLLEDLRGEGVTDYFAMPLEFTHGEIHACSYTTRREGGFSEAEIAALRRIRPALARVAEIYALIRTARNLLDAYLGRQAGEKVLRGQIKRGDGQELHAVIWFCDLRNSTPLADSMSREAFLQLLNEYFECMLDPVLARGGEVLRFIGDAALAIFPAGQETAIACSRALEAAREAIARMAALNARRESFGAPPLGFGIGLHLGDVMYGNIGTPTRIEFTVIGAAANEAARIESLCKRLNTSLVVSEQVVRHLPGSWKPLGRHALRGVGEPAALFTLP